MYLNKLNICLVLILINLELFLSYKLPSLHFKILKPKGLQVSIPDEIGIKYFAFHGAINKFIQNPRPGDFDGIVSSPDLNNRWTYINDNIEIQPNDIIYFWFHIQNNNTAYQILYRSFSIGNCVNEIDLSTTTDSLIIKQQNTPYFIPTPTIEKLSPQGFRLSIPDDPEIKLFAFHGCLNHKLHKYQPGSFNMVLTMPRENRNGRWYYENNSIVINENEDILNYWLHVQHGNIAFTTPVKSFSFKTTNTTSLSYARINEMTKSIDTCDDIIPVDSVTIKIISTELENDNDIDNQITTIPSINDKINCDETSITTVTNHLNKICKGQLIFEDNFNEFDKNKWQTEIKFGGLDDEFVFYRNDKNNYYIKNGHLIILPTSFPNNPNNNRPMHLNLKERCTEDDDISISCERNPLSVTSSIVPPIASAKIRTKNSFSFRYGRIEVRAKLPKGDWIFPQIFLEPLDNFYGKNYASGQMRVAFIRGNECLESKEGERIDGHRVYGGVVIDKNINLRDIWMKSSDLKNEHLSSEFHVYSLIWSNEKIIMEIDGEKYGEINGDFGTKAHKNELEFASKWQDGNPMAPFDKDFFISLGLGAGGNGDFPDGTTNCFKDDEKPWLNLNNKAELHFWNERRKWKKTWIADSTRLVVDYVRVYAI